MTETEAMEFAFNAHKGQKYGDREYFYHLSGVAGIVRKQSYDSDFIIVAWLHDVLEDTPTTVDDLISLGVSEAQLAAIKAITKSDEECYSSYIDRVKKNMIARVVKIADALFNLNQCVNDRSYKRARKYNEVLSKLI